MKILVETLNKMVIKKCEVGFLSFCIVVFSTSLSLYLIFGSFPVWPVVIIFWLAVLYLLALEMSKTTVLDKHVNHVIRSKWTVKGKVVERYVLDQIREVQLYPSKRSARDGDVQFYVNMALIFKNGSELLLDTKKIELRINERDPFGFSMESSMEKGERVALFLGVPFNQDRRFY